jgi:uncharacterized protein (DUF433 family)
MNTGSVWGARVPEMLAMRKAGATVNDIAKRFDATYYAAEFALRFWCVPRQVPKPEDVVKDAMRLQAEGWSVEDIAAKFRVNWRSLANAMTRQRKRDRAA